MARPVVRLTAVLFLASLVAAGFESLLQAQPKKSDAYVKVSATGSKLDADGKQTITVTIQIDKGWHIYANPVGNDALKSVQTVVSVSGQEKLKDVKVEYPAGKLVKDEIVGDWRIYEGKVAIKAHILRASGETGPLEVSVKLLTVNDWRNMLMATVKVPVE